jgi:hypothetical protein
MPWDKILPILQLIWSAVSPELKSLALGELKSLEVQDASQPLLLALIKEAETMLQVI